MSRAVRTVYLKRPQDAGYTDVSDWVDAADYEPPSASLSAVPTTATVALVDPDGTLPFPPDDGVEVRMDDATPTTVFGGWVSGPVTTVPGARVPSYKLVCRPWAARLSEVPNGSLNKSGVQDTDRNFLIAMFTDALAAAALAVGVDPMVDDPLLTANANAGWPGVQGTTFLYGTDWSYRDLLTNVQDLVKRVPDVSFRIRADKIVEYGIFTTPAPVALASSIDAALMSSSKVVVIDANSYQEETLSNGHRNKVRLGGAGAAEATAYDTHSIGAYGRVMPAPYVNDESIAAADVTRAAYAKLASLAVRRVVRVEATSDADALEPGMLVPVCVTDVGCLDDEGWLPPRGELYIGTPLGEPATGYRGEMVVQKVRPAWVAPGVQRYEVELGAYVADFDHALAARIGGGSVG